MFQRKVRGKILNLSEVENWDSLCLCVLWRSLDVFSKFFSSSFFSLEHSKLTACFFSGWLALTEKSCRTKKSQVNFIWKAFQNSNPFFRFNSCFCHFSHLVSTCLLNFFFLLTINFIPRRLSIKMYLPWSISTRVSYQRLLTVSWVFLAIAAFWLVDKST